MRCSVLSQKFTEEVSAMSFPYSPPGKGYGGFQHDPQSKFLFQGGLRRLAAVTILKPMLRHPNVRLFFPKHRGIYDVDGIAGSVSENLIDDHAVVSFVRFFLDITEMRRADDVIHFE